VICLYASSPALRQTVTALGPTERFTIVSPTSLAAFYDLVAQDKQRLDCLILEQTPQLPQLINWLQAEAILLPTVILATGRSTPEPATDRPTYHDATITLSSLIDDLTQLTNGIDQAITAFLNLSPACPLPAMPPDPQVQLTTESFLVQQQQRLTQKLKERLGYLGVYYKRNSKNFFRHLSAAEQQELLDELQADYREIILRYFQEDSSLNQKLDDFVNVAFFADISVAQIVEIHMQLMDEFSTQLKLEGRSEEVLLDYRLTLIDTIAHLCEMYRRSIPRES
jgi:circadian clock protein KaiA